MITLKVSNQPVTINMDMGNVVSFNETTKTIQAFMEATKQVSEDVDGIPFTTNRIYDKKVLIEYGFLPADLQLSFINAFKNVLAGTVESVDINGIATYNTDATITVQVETFTEVLPAGV